jgi:2-keto-3-deoxy-L-fuconate dehydrogenase
LKQVTDDIAKNTPAFSGSAKTAHAEHRKSMGRVQDKLIVITGAGHGIGRASALMLSREGGTVWASDIDTDALDDLKRQDERINAVKMDVRRESDVETLSQKLGAIDVLFNCAGYVATGSILECREEEWDSSFDLNAKSMFRTIRAFLPAMLKEGRAGSIINMASIVSSTKGAPNRFAYGASKAAVVGLTKSISADFSARGIRCNAICPATIVTPSLERRVTDQAAELGKSNEEVYAAFVARQPIGRLGRPEEIAALVTYLASDESSFTTGTTQIIDAGWSG